MIADDVATYLAEQLNYTKGRDLFVNNYDNKKTELVCVFDTGSVNIDPYQDVDTFTIQVLVKSKKHSIAKKKAVDVYQLINRKQGLEMGVFTGRDATKYSYAIQAPYLLEVENEVFTIVANYQVLTCIRPPAGTDVWLWDTGDKILWDTGDAILI